MDLRGKMDSGRHGMKRREEKFCHCGECALADDSLLDAARRAGRAKGLREAAEIIRVLVGGIGGHPMVDAILARAEEVDHA